MHYWFDTSKPIYAIGTIKELAQGGKRATKGGKEGTWRGSFMVQYEDGDYMNRLMETNYNTEWSFIKEDKDGDVQPQFAHQPWHDHESQVSALFTSADQLRV